jgi:hypothetical protein
MKSGEKINDLSLARTANVDPTGAEFASDSARPVMRRSFPYEERR